MLSGRDASLHKWSTTARNSGTSIGLSSGALVASRSVRLPWTRVMSPPGPQRKLAAPALPATHLFTRFPGVARDRVRGGGRVAGDSDDHSTLLVADPDGDCRSVLPIAGSDWDGDKLPPHEKLPAVASARRFSLGVHALYEKIHRLTISNRFGDVVTVTTATFHSRRWHGEPGRYCQPGEESGACLPECENDRQLRRVWRPT